MAYSNRVRGITSTNAEKNHMRQRLDSGVGAGLAVRCAKEAMVVSRPSQARMLSASARERLAVPRLASLSSYFFFRGCRDVAMAAGENLATGRRFGRRGGLQLPCGRMLPGGRSRISVVRTIDSLLTIRISYFHNLPKPEIPHLIRERGKRLDTSPVADGDSAVLSCGKCAVERTPRPCSPLPNSQFPRTVSRGAESAAGGVPQWFVYCQDVAGEKP